MFPLPVITDDLLSAFLACRYKGYLKASGESGEPSDFPRLQDRLDAEYRATALTRPPAHPGRPRKDPRPVDGSWPPKIGAELFAGGESCRPDGLEPAVGGHEPILCLRRNRATRADRLRLAFQGSVLGRSQGHDPKAGTIIHGPKYARMRIRLAPTIAAARAAVAELTAMAAAPEPPRAVLNRHCPDCEFRTRCRTAAVGRDDLSLLSGLKEKEIARLHGNGVFTVTQYAYTFRPGRLKKVAKETGRKHDLALQALAVRDKQIFVVQRPTIPCAKAQVYLDVEGLTDPDRYYLAGLLVVAGDEVRHVGLWADDAADEPGMWAKLLKEVARLADDFAVFHYGSYDARFLRRMAEQYGGDSTVLARLEKQAVNVLSLIHGRVYFPAYTNGLKDVAGCLGFKWAATEPSGRQAIVWRHEWEATRDPAIKTRLIEYNRDDCAALRRVTDALRAIAAHAGVGGAEPLPVAEAGDVKAPKRHKFGDLEYALPDFGRAAKCAYFDYQRDKVLFRTSPAVKRANRLKKEKFPRVREDRAEVIETPATCPACGAAGVESYGGWNTRLVVDLRMVRGGLRRHVTRYRAKRFVCAACKHDALPPEFVAIKDFKYGWTMCGWVAYSTVALKQTNTAIVEAVADLFDIPIASGVVCQIRKEIGDRYRATYEGILAHLRAGTVVHADETWAQLKHSRQRGYVWVFASPDAAAYVYAPTREGETARQVLDGFKGVLVSDFYAVYDSLDCPQQKCLVHLLRDLNEDLLKHPFDAELKELSAAFGAVVRAAVETIDQHGLKKYFLAKHQMEADELLDKVERAEYASEVARGYQARLVKGRGKLFTFLAHDGVPWNNNNAENAVKRFVSRRKAMEGVGAFGEQGLKDYLALLSIYQTLRYRGLSFWQFLRSGETDLDKFTARSCRSSGPPRRSRAADADLASVIHAWPKIAKQVRAGILAMVRATSG